jgi:hypothetical protein
VTDTGQTVPGTGPAVSRARAPQYRDTTSAWVGWVVFAAAMMIMVGSFHALAGLVALFQDEYFVTTSEGLVISVDYTAWGWTHLLLGAFVAGAGVALFAGKTWARVVGVVVAGISALTNMVFIGAYPLWSIVIITLDVVVIYALIVHGRDVQDIP